MVVVLKVASSLVAEPAKFWPPALPDCVETIAASYVQSQNTSKVRLFNLSPDTKVAGMICSADGATELASNVRYSLGSTWHEVPTESASFTAKDDLTGKVLVSKTETPPAAPLGYTNFLVGLQGGSGDLVAQMVPLADAPEGGVCKPGA